MAKCRSPYHPATARFAHPYSEFDSPQFSSIQRLEFSSPLKTSCAQSFGLHIFCEHWRLQGISQKMANKEQPMRSRIFHLYLFSINLWRNQQFENRFKWSSCRRAVQLSAACSRCSHRYRQQECASQCLLSLWRTMR